MSRIWVGLSLPILKCLQCQGYRTASISATKAWGQVGTLTRSAINLHRHLRTSTTAELKMFDDSKMLLIPPEKANYFEVFDFEPSFDLDVRDLSQKFRDMQVLLHPDKHGMKSDSQRDLSDQWSSLVNNAYQTLLKPLSRALYMLELDGKPLEEDDVGTEVAFLGEIMELNEEVAEAEFPRELAGISERNLDVVNDYVRKISSAFQSGDTDQARELTAKMKYYCTLQEKIVQKEMEMGV